jgi:hypothetical protein
MRGGLASTAEFEDEEGLAVPHFSFMLFVLVELEGRHRLGGWL